MSRGSQIVTVRIPAKELERIDLEVARSETTRVKGPHTRTSWMLEAIREKLDKPNRRRRAVERKRAAAAKGEQSDADYRL